MPAKLTEYYRLTKPGIIYGNLLTTAGGFLFAAGRSPDVRLLAATLLGTGLIIGSACVYNNYLDRHIDARMTRTAKRAMVQGTVSVKAALAYGALLGVAGTAILTLLTNPITVALGVIGFIAYVLIYTYAKRHTVHSTLIGTISGATPIVAGYTAVTGRFDLTALILFSVMVIWQMPHFYAIAMFRKDDYAAANIPVLSVAKGLRTTRTYTIWYIAGLLPVVGALAVFGRGGYIYAVVMSGFVLYWLAMALLTMQQGLAYAAWARRVFGNSLIFLLLFSIMLSVDAWLP
ncbi:MAG TPA: heme o synthase [Candidatus Saccharimonadales bacterium]|nr:heme o synthase [Candidatus Saccharimonadales bacterium]